MSGGLRRGRVAGVVLLVGLLVSLAGCAGIPHDGTVERVGPVAPADRAPFVDVIAPGPRAGDSPVAIAEGFLLAMASYDPGYPVAHEYLTPAASADWQPDAGITVFDTAGASQDASREALVRLDLPVVGRVEPDGSYRRAVTDERQQLDLALQQVDGEWRIATPPAGLVMTSFDFDREFRSFSRYLFDPGYQVLVPDPVRLPRSGNLSTLLATALLSGPSSWLAPAVRTSVPAGTTLAIRSVPVELGVARVDLTAAAAEASPQQRDRMAAQMATTLAQVDGVEAVALSVDGSPLVLPDAPDGVRAVDADPEYDPAVLSPGVAVHGLVDGHAAVLGRGDPEPVPGPFGSDVPLRSVAVSVDGTRLAGVSADGRRLLLVNVGPAGAVRQVAAGTDLSRPSFDRSGLLWVADRGPGVGRVLAFGADGAPTPVTLDGGDRHDVQAVRISLDGTRAALVTEVAGRGALRVAVVLRGADGLRLSGVRSTRAALEDVSDAAWYSPGSLAVLAVLPGASSPQPFVLDIDAGEPVARGPVVDAVALAAAPERQLVVATADGRLLRQDAALRWADIGAAQAPAYPG